VAIVIDGYNVLFAIAHHGGQTVAEALEEARRRMLRELAIYARETGERITVIFDSARGAGGATTEERHGGVVRVRYTHPPRTADDDLRRLVEATPRPQSLLVVTSDRELGHDCRTRGARVVGSMSFYLDMSRRADAGREDEEEMLLKNQAPTAAEVREWLKTFGET